MKKKELNGKDLLLSFLYSPGMGTVKNEKIVGRTKIQKMMFLFEKQIYQDFFSENLQISLPEFSPYYFGPFSRELYEDLSFFISIGMIKTESTTIPLAPVDVVENYDMDFGNADESLSFDNQGEINDYEKEYFLSDIGIKYVEDNIWANFSPIQQEKLRDFKKKINQISLDALLNYVYNKYPEETTKSIIAKKYLK